MERQRGNALCISLLQLREPNKYVKTQWLIVIALNVVMLRPFSWVLLKWVNGLFRQVSCREIVEKWIVVYFNPANENFSLLFLDD